MCYDNYFMLTPLSRIREYYVEDLAKYKTNASKKAYLTREYKKVEEWAWDLLEAMQRPSRRLHGKYVRRVDYLQASKELDIITELRNNL